MCRFPEPPLTHQIAVNEDSCFCYIGPITAYQTVCLITVQLPEDSADWSDDEAIAFDCIAHRMLDENGDVDAQEEYALDREAALDFCVEGVLDGLAGLVADEHEILAPSLTAAAREPMVDVRVEAPQQSPAQLDDQPRVAAPPDFLDRLFRNGWLWFIVITGALGALAQLSRLSH